ncbi:MAG: hypothetical protein V4819_07180 [Verrucomicrobiota bacterium]
MALRFLRDGQSPNRVFSWDLAGLPAALDAKGLCVSCLQERPLFASVRYER